MYGGKVYPFLIYSFGDKWGIKNSSVKIKMKFCLQIIDQRIKKY